METGKLGFVQTALPEGSVAVTAAREAADRMHVQAALATFYVRTMTGPPQPALPPPVTPQLQPTQTQLPAGTQDMPAIALPIPALCSKQPLPILTLQLAGGVPLTPSHAQKCVGVGAPGGALCPSKPPKSVGKHVCQYCGRDCLKPSVLQKHLRCHTGERPYPCTVCGISFKTQSNLYKHKRTQAHARISSESDRGSLSSQESLHSSRDTCFSSSLSLETQSQDYGSQEGSDVTATQPIVTAGESGSIQSEQNQENTGGSGTARALQQAALVSLIAAPMEVQKEVLTCKAQQVEPPCGNGVVTTGRDSKRPAGGEGPRPCSGAPLTPNRHLPLQRQEATLSPKLWDSMSMSRSKSQSHDSTDSGFSDSGEHHWASSPGSSLHDHSMELLTESSMEAPEHQPVCQMNSDSALAGESKSKVSVQEKRQLEERISKIISKNDALMDDKHLENVRPRKTVLSKQGSIDLPMPYTYKDSFHFEMKSTTTASKQVSISPGPDRKGIQAFCSSLPSQHADKPEHAPLTRSSSLPFSVNGQCGDTVGTAPLHRTDSISLSRRSSAGHLYHRSLVRQVAVDCQPEASPTDRGSLSSLSSEPDCPDTTSQSTGRSRKRAQKLKWYMYGDGMFRKLYGGSSEKELDPSLLKTQRPHATSLEQLSESQDMQIGQVQDLVSGAQVAVPTANVSLGTMQSTLCHSNSLALGLSPASTACADKRHNSGVSSYVLLQGSMLKTAGPPQQRTESRAIQGTEIFSPKGTLMDTSFESVPQHNSLPSERKKQRTEENVSVLTDSMDTEMKEDSVAAYKIGWTDGDMSNSVNQSLAPMERESNRPRIQRQDSLVCPRITPRQPLQKRHSSPLCVVNVSRPSELQITTSSTTPNITTTSTTTTSTTCLPARTSFPPKYQLKLPQSSGGVDSFPCRVAPSTRHSFSSSQIFTTCAPRSGHSDSITSFTTLTQSQPVTPIALFQSQQSGSNRNAGLNASGLPVPISTWSPPAVAVGGLTHSLSVSALAAPYPAASLSLRTANDTPWTPQNQMVTMVTPAIPGQSYTCKTVLAQDQFGSISVPRHHQPIIPAIPHNQTTPTAKLYLEQPHINGTGTPVSPVPVQGHLQQVRTITDLAQNPTTTSATVFSASRPIKPVTGITVDQTPAPAAGLYQKAPATPKTVFSINQPVIDASFNQPALPVTLQCRVQQSQTAAGLNQSISAKPITVFATTRPLKPTREVSLSQTATPLTVQYPIQKGAPVVGIAQNLPITASTIFCTSQPVKHLTDMSLNQMTPEAVQNQMHELTTVTQLDQRHSATSTKIFASCRAVKPDIEVSLSQAITPVQVQFHVQQARGLAKNLPLTPITIVSSSQAVKQVTDMAPPPVETPTAVPYVIQHATPLTVLSQKSPSEAITASSLSQPTDPVSDIALKQAGNHAKAQYHIQQPTTATPTSHTQLATPITVISHSQPPTTAMPTSYSQLSTPAIVISHSQPPTTAMPTSHSQLSTPITVISHCQPPTAASVRSQCQPDLSGVDNSQTAIPLPAIPPNQPPTAASVRSQCQPDLSGVDNSQTAVSLPAIPPNQPGVVQHLQTCTPASSAAAQLQPPSAAAPLQNGGSTSVSAPLQPPAVLHTPASPSLRPVGDVATATSSSTSMPKEELQGGSVVRLGEGGVAQAPAQDMFFMRTPDLQIVMQLISDEQLALMAPQIEAADYRQGAGCPSIITGSTQPSRTEMRGLHAPASQDVGVNVNNRSNDTNSPQEGPTHSTIMSTNGAVKDVGVNVNNRSYDTNSPQEGPVHSTIMSTNEAIKEQPGCAASVSAAEPSCPASLHINSNSSPQTERPDQSQVSASLGTAQSLDKPNQIRMEAGQTKGFGIKQSPRTEERDSNAAQLTASEESSRTEYVAMEAHIPLHKQQLSAWLSYPVLHNPTMQGCVGKEFRQQSSVCGLPSSVTAMKAYPLTTPKALPGNVGVPVPYQDSQMSGVSAGVGVSVGSSGPVSAARRVVDVDIPLLPASHTSPPAAPYPSGRAYLSERKSPSHSVCPPGVLPCPPNVSNTTATTQANPHHRELDVPVKPQAPSAEGQLAPTHTLAVSLLQPAGSLPVLSDPTGLSQPNDSSAVLGDVVKDSQPASSSTLVEPVSASCTGLHKLPCTGGCLSPAPPAVQANGQHKPLCPGDALEGCNRRPLSRSSATEACAPGRTSGEPQLSQRALGQAERDQLSSAGRRVEVGGGGGAVEQDQGNARNVLVEPTQVSVRQERIPRPEETPRSIRADKGAGDGGPPRSPLPPGECGSGGPGRGPEGLQSCGEQRNRAGKVEEEEEKEEEDKRPGGQAGGDRGGRGQNTGGADERMERTSSHEPIWTLAVPLPPPPPPPPPSLETPNPLLTLNLQPDPTSSPASPLQPPGHLTSCSSGSSQSSPTPVRQPRALAQGPPRAHCWRPNSARRYQEAGEAPAPGTSGAPPPCSSSPGDLPLHAPSEAANHSEAQREGPASATACLQCSGHAASEAPDPRPLGLCAGGRPDSPPRGPASRETPSRAAKTRSAGVAASLSSSLRGARKCMEDEEENSSSSDDEGKLVIEFEPN